MKGTLVIYLGLDCITGKLFDPMGNVKLVLRHPLSLITSGDNVEQDPEEWLEAVTSMLGKAQNAFGDIDVCELTMVYQPGTFVCIDRTGRHLMNAVLPCDCRSRYQARNCQKMNYKHSESIGIPWGLMLLPRLLWIKYNRPDAYRDIYMVLTPDGYISYRLCGETAIDENSALFFGYNPKTNSYNGRIFNRLGIETEFMPPVKKIGETIGIIYPATEDGSWIKSSIKIILSSNCITSISLYYEAKDGGTAVFDCESSTVCTFARRLRRRRDDVLLTFPMEEEGFNMYGIMGNYELRFLECIKSMIKYENIEKDFIPGSRGVMAFPYIAGEGSFYCCDMRGGIIGIEGSPSDIISAIYEAIGYSLRERLECFSHCGIDIDTIIAVPGINDRGFYQILSDITSRDILTGDKNMDCLGCTYNIINNRTLDKSTLGPKIIPNRENTDLYRCLSSLHKGAYNSLNDIYRYRRKLLK